MSEHVVVIGGVALGPKAACRFKRLCPDASVTMIDQAEHISYGGCGIPYYVSAEVQNLKDLQSTPYHTVRDPAFFQSAKGVTALINTRALSIDREKKEVLTENLVTGEQKKLSYDKLVLATGAAPRKLPLPGAELTGITACTNLIEAKYIRERAEARDIQHAVIVGAGFIGLEMAVALTEMWGIPTTVVEMADQVLPGIIDKTLSRMAEADFAQNDVTLHLGETLKCFEGEGGKVTRVVTDKRTIETDLVITAAGISPATKLAKEAGLELIANGAVRVNAYMQTSDPDIYTGGDCASVTNLITGEPGFFPLGSLANRQGRVIGTNLAGGKATFPGAVGSWGIKLFKISLAGSGLSLDKAQEAGFDAIKVHIEQADRAHFYPENTYSTLILVVERSTRRVLGIQGMSAFGDSLIARVNPVAALLQHKPVIEDISNLEIVYSPPFSSAMDIVNVTGNVAENILEGRYVAMTVDEFEALWQARADETHFFADARPAAGAIPFEEKYPGQWHSIPTEELANHIDDLPEDKTVVFICNIGLRAYEAQLALRKAGKSCINVQGGMSAVKKQGQDF